MSQKSQSIIFASAKNTYLFNFHLPVASPIHILLNTGMQTMFYDKTIRINGCV